MYKIIVMDNQFFPSITDDLNQLFGSVAEIRNEIYGSEQY